MHLIKEEEGEEKKEKTEKEKALEQIMMGLGIIIRAIVIFFVISLLFFGVWNLVLAKTITFIKPMTSFWQAALFALFTEIIMFITMYRLDLLN